MPFQVRKASDPIVAALVAANNARQVAAVGSNFHASATRDFLGHRAGFANTDPVAAITNPNAANDVDFLLDAVATSLAAQEFDDADFENEGDEFDVARYIVVTTSSTAGAFVNASEITVTGIVDGDVDTEVFALTGTDGGQTLYGTKLFEQVTAIDVDEQGDTDGTISVGVAGVPEAAAILNRAKAILNQHYAEPVTHQLQTTALISTADADEVLAGANTLANAIKASYNTHRTAGGVHYNNDATNAVAATDATTIATLYTLANEIKTDVTAHVANATPGAAINLIGP